MKNMRFKIVNSCLVGAVVVILVVAAFHVRVGATADQVVVLRTSGMTCSSCVSKITKALQAERGVAAAEVDLAGGVVIAGYDSKQVVPDHLAKTVAAAGFDSEVAQVLTPQQFKSLAGRDLGAKSAPGGCCGPRGCTSRQ